MDVSQDFKMKLSWKHNLIKNRILEMLFLVEIRRRKHT